MNVKEAYSYSVQFLKANQVDEADFKALNIVCHLIGIQNSEYANHKEDYINTKKLADCLWRLKTGEPLQYVMGKWDFYKSEFCVGKGVLIPRPETEELVELVIQQAKTMEKPIIVDLCSGSGCIGISIAREIQDAVVYCVEKSTEAIKYLKKNSEHDKNVYIIHDDIFYDIDLPAADIIVSNPPYIKTSDLLTLQREVKQEPEMALDGGKDGLDFYRCIHDKWYGKLKSDGYLFLEIAENQASDMKKIFSDFKSIEVKKDLYGNDRMVIAHNKQ